jgi:hypothetical protein
MVRRCVGGSSRIKESQKPGNTVRRCYDQ